MKSILSNYRAAGRISIGLVVWACMCESSVNAAMSPGLDRMQRFDLLPQILQGTQVRQVSSYDRSGGNDDGFDGTYSALYIDGNGEYVLFDEIGAGCIYRIWLTYSSGFPEYGENRLRFYFDNEPVARLDLTIDEFFSGTHHPLLFPLAGRRHQSSHGYYSYLPFPYRERLKITMNSRPYFYGITYHRLA